MTLFRWAQGFSVVIAFVALVCAISKANAQAPPPSAQTDAQPAPSQPARLDIEVDKLEGLRYPPLARQARIMGDVAIRIAIRHDGSVISAEVVSGHPMLQAAALESAQKSSFRCWPECAEGTTFVFVYTFGMRLDGPCCCASGERLRSPKCLYLWKCGAWRSLPGPPPALGASPNRAIILADAACVETNSSAVGPSPPKQ